MFTLVILLPLVGRRDWASVRARLGGLTPEHEGTRHVWCHAASNGELASLRPVLAGLVDARPDLAWLVTCNSSTGAALVDSWGLPRVQSGLAPLDLRGRQRRMIRRFGIVAAITVEAELWPNRITVLEGPTLVLGGRLTPKTLRLWSRFGAYGRRVMARLAFVSPQDHGSAARFAEAGVRDDAMGPVVDLKGFYAPPDMRPDAALVQAFPRETTWLAASTHDGEEAIVAEAHKLMLAGGGQDRMILAPRHPKRGDAIARLLSQAGLTVARRSAGAAPSDGAVYLADTMGEMALWYQLAGRVYIGGSQTDLGGHTPYESAHFGQAILHGPDTRNQKAAYEQLHAAGAARVVHNAAELAQALMELEPVAAQDEAGGKARDALRQEGDVTSLTTTVLGYLPQD